MASLSQLPLARLLLKKQTLQLTKLRLKNLHVQHVAQKVVQLKVAKHVQLKAVKHVQLKVVKRLAKALSAKLPSNRIDFRAFWA